VPSPTKTLLAGDLHIPCHDPAAVDALLARLRAWRPQHLVILGDLLDCATVGRWPKAPSTPNLAAEIETGRKILAKIRKAAGSARLQVCEGNHESRLARMIWTRAAGLDGLPGLSIRELLGISEAEWLPYGVLARAPGVVAYHGALARARAGTTAHGELQRIGTAAPVLVTGHTHRLARVSRTDQAGTWVACEAGCLAGDGAASYIIGQPDWQRGWVEVTTRRTGAPDVRCVAV